MAKTPRKKAAPKQSSDPQLSKTVVQVIPAGCPRCGSTRRRVLRISATREMPGTTPTGQERTHIVWRRVRCDVCGQHYAEQTHEHRGQ